MKFLVLSRREIQRYKGTKPYVVISISDVREKRARLKPDKFRLSYMYLKLDDIGKPINGYFEFTKADAHRILSFFYKWSPAVDLIVINCEAGISRSAAVAAALSKVCGQDDSEFFKRFHPNDLVYKTILFVHYRNQYSQ